MMRLRDDGLPLNLRLSLPTPSAPVPVRAGVVE